MLDQWNSQIPRDSYVSMVSDRVCSLCSKGVSFFRECIHVCTWKNVTRKFSCSWGPIWLGITSESSVPLNTHTMLLVLPHLTPPTSFPIHQKQTDLFPHNRKSSTWKSNDPLVASSPLKEDQRRHLTIRLMWTIFSWLTHFTSTQPKVSAYTMFPPTPRSDGNNNWSSFPIWTN